MEAEWADPNILSLVLLSLNFEDRLVRKQSVNRKFSNKGASPNKGAPLFSEGYSDSKCHVFGHISAKNGPIFIL